MTNLFEHATQQANVWVKDMMQELRQTDPHKALRVLRAGLQTLRDRMTIDEAAALSAQLPLVLRGVFFEGWVPKGKPLQLSHKAEFLDLFVEKYGHESNPIDGASAHASDFVVALFRVLNRHVSTGEVTKIVMTLPEELVELVSGRSLLERAEDR